jgi:transglutaminase-like putative cysteine protease
MGSSHPVPPTIKDWEAHPAGRQSSLGELSGLEESAPRREEIHSVGTTPVEKGNEVPTPPNEETRSNGVKPMETATGETSSEEDSRGEQPAAGMAASQATPEDDSCEGKTLEATPETSLREKTPEGSEPEETPTEESTPEVAELAQLIDGSSDVKWAEPGKILFPVNL